METVEEQVKACTFRTGGSLSLPVIFLHYLNRSAPVLVSLSHSLLVKLKAKEKFVTSPAPHLHPLLGPPVGSCPPLLLCSIPEPPLPETVGAICASHTHILFL